MELRQTVHDLIDSSGATAITAGFHDTQRHVQVGADGVSIYEQYAAIRLPTKSPSHVHS
ncbi:MAG: hypothetical protein ACYDC5_06150 [Candidatus Dormibacteria bacterium]